MADYAGDYALISEAQDPRKRVEHYKQWFRQSHDATDVWRARAIEAYQFVSGNQWSESDLQKLERQRRPALVINRVLAPVLFLAGVQRQQRTEPRIEPWESADVRPAELMNALIKWVGKESDEPSVDSAVFLDKVITGMGFWKLGLDFEERPEGDLRWERVSPLSVFWDPNFPDAKWRETQYVIHAVWMDLRSAAQKWPEHKEDLRRQFGEWLGGEHASGTHSNLAVSGEYAGDSMADKRLFWDAQTQRARVLEIFYVERRPVTVVIDNETQNVTSDEISIEQARAAVKQQPDLKDRLTFVQRSVKQIKMAHVLNTLELDHDDSPYDQPRFPIFPTVGYYFWRHPFGVVEPMKDPQREKNRRRSTIVEMVMRMPHSGFLNHATRGAKTADIEEFATGNGAVINYDETPPTQIASPDLPQTLVYLDRASDEEVKTVVNINNELLGNTTQRTVSGRAIDARQRSGLVVQEPLLDSFERDKEQAARFMVNLIQQYMPVTKAMRVLGSLAARRDDIQVQNQYQGALAMITETPPPELLQTLSEAFSVEFDVSIRSTPYDPSLNRIKWQTLQDLLKEFGPYIPPDLVVEALRDAGLISDQYAQRITQWVNQQEQMKQATVASAAQSGAVPPAESLAAA